MTESRIEFDPLGSKEIPKEAYYGIQTLRAHENFAFTGQKIHPELIYALAKVKKAALMVNMDLGILGQKRGEALLLAADEVLRGKHLEQFILDPLQGGAGTSINMNMNEVLANRALEILGKNKGDYNLIHPNNHVNMGQSTNDVIPTAARIGAINLLRNLTRSYQELISALESKGEEFDTVLKMGRTHLQDAVPIRLGQEFKAYALALKRDLKRFQAIASDLLEINIGATAVGTGLNADLEYVKVVSDKLKDLTGINLRQASDLVDATQNQDQLLALSSVLKTAAANLNKIANDLRLLSSGPRAGINEINLPSVQPGSSIMPAKVNPVIAEAINQISYQVQGNDLTIALAVQNGQLELNVMMPVLIFNLYQSLEILAQGANIFALKCIKGITANQERCLKMVENSLGIITAICPHVGYETACRLAKLAQESDENLRDILLSEGILTAQELDLILDPFEMTQPGIAGRELLSGYDLEEE